MKSTWVFLPNVQNERMPRWHAVGVCVCTCTYMPVPSLVFLSGVLGLLNAFNLLQGCPHHAWHLCSWQCVFLLSDFIVWCSVSVTFSSSVFSLDTKFWLQVLQRLPKILSLLLWLCLLLFFALVFLRFCLKAFWTMCCPTLDFCLCTFRCLWPLLLPLSSVCFEVLGLYFFLWNCQHLTQDLPRGLILC